MINNLLLRTIAFITASLIVLTTTGCTDSPYTPEQQAMLEHYEQGKEKRGQVYFQHVCSHCHQQQYQIEVPPKDYTIAQWHDYFQKNEHLMEKNRHPFTDFFTLEYREQLAHNNKVLTLMLGLSDEEIKIDVAKYIINGAKDSDNPQSCN
jgi:cytochrome c5